MMEGRLKEGGKGIACLFRFFCLCGRFGKKGLNGWMDGRQSALEKASR